MLFWFAMFLLVSVFFAYLNSTKKAADKRDLANKLARKIRERERKIRKGEIDPDDPDERAIRRSKRRNYR